MAEEGQGVLYCCGKRLVWMPQEGTNVYEVTCEKCGTMYAMDKGEELEYVEKHLQFITE